MSKPIPLPSDAGTEYNLPQEVRGIANLRDPVIAWTSIDPKLEGELSKYICCTTFGPFVFMPCFWPHFLIIWPCLIGCKVANENSARSQVWILTRRELKIVSLDHDTCCCPGLSKSGNKVKTVPLENITDVGIASRGSGVANNWAGDIPSIYVDTASGNKGTHEATGVALNNAKWFIQETLNYRDALKGATGSYSYVTPVIANAMGDRDGKQQQQHSAAERMQELKVMFDQGLITQDEYDSKRQDIIRSV